MFLKSLRGKIIFFFVLNISCAQLHAQDLKAIYNYGKAKGWSSQIQENQFNKFFTQWSETDKQKFFTFLNLAKTSSAKYFVLKSWLAGDDSKTLIRFINELNAYPENYQQQRCLATSNRSIIQQWENSCSVTTVQTFLGDLCPRYMWEVKNITSYNSVSQDQSNPMAQQQKMLLEHYGGTVSKRGDASGINIGILNPLNEFVGGLLGVRFYAQEVAESMPSIFSKIRDQLNKGIDVPILVGFANSANMHFMLVMKYSYTNNEYHYLIYDPWDGVCNYVSQSNIINGSLSPLNNSWKIQIKYYYPVIDLSPEEVRLINEKRRHDFKVNN